MSEQKKPEQNGQTHAAQVLERLAYLQELREKRQALRAKGKHDLALTQVINDIDQEVCEWPAARLREAHAALTAQAEEVKGLREALSGLVNLNENPPPDEPRRGVLANMAWTQARAALAQAGEG